MHAEYVNALVEISASLQLSRNIFVALFSLQSWKPFMRHWMGASISSYVKSPSVASDKVSKAANDILKVKDGLHALAILLSSLVLQKFVC